MTEPLTRAERCQSGQVAASAPGGDQGLTSAEIDEIRDRLSYAEQEGWSYGLKATHGLILRALDDLERCQGERELLSNEAGRLADRLRRLVGAVEHRDARWQTKPELAKSHTALASYDERRRG